MFKFLPGTHQQCKLIGITQHLLNVTILNQITYLRICWTDNCRKLNRLFIFQNLRQ